MTLLTIMVAIFGGFKTGFSGLPGTGLSRPYPANGIAEIRHDRTQSWSRGSAESAGRSTVLLFLRTASSCKSGFLYGVNFSVTLV
jgi:hypothetical protein